MKGSYFAFSKVWIGLGEGGCADFCSLCRDGSVRREKNQVSVPLVLWHCEVYGKTELLSVVMRQWA